MLDLIEQHRSTIVFANSRRLAERLCARLNELAAERAELRAGNRPGGRARWARARREHPQRGWAAARRGGAPGRDHGAGREHRRGAPPVVARAHHGSVSREERAQIEEALKAGRLPAVVATSSLELGIDMGAVDLVVQVESPPSVASGLQRIGRAGHKVGDVSRGVIFPKYQGDLVQSAVVARRMRGGEIESLQDAAQPARRAGPADRGDDGDGRLGRRRAGAGGPARRAVRRADPAGARGRARHAGRALPERRVRRAAAPAGLGPDHRAAARPPRRPAARRHQRRHDPRPRPVRRLPGRVAARGERPALAPGGRAGRGDGLRVPGRRRVRARRELVADRGHHRRPGPGLPGPRAAGEAAVLARGRRWAARWSWAARSARTAANWAR